MTPDGIAAQLAAHRLAVFGGFHPGAGQGLPASIQTLLLIGPAEPGFWPHVMAQPEWRDGRPDPLDRWSRRVIGRLACALRAKAYFPFGGPPWRPFPAWARASGRAWDSPVQLLVHDTAGLMLSYRGALGLRQRLDLPVPGRAPCPDCAAPCLTACPAGAMVAGHYDIDRCHAWRDGPGVDCRNAGCLARRACPVSVRYGRVGEQSAFHMKQFHP